MVLGRQLVDENGDEVISAKLCGHGWRTRHTQMEKLIIMKCSWAGVPVQSEVFLLFSDERYTVYCGTEAGQVGPVLAKL